MKTNLVADARRIIVETPSWLVNILSRGSSDGIRRGIYYSSAKHRLVGEKDEFVIFTEKTSDKDLILARVIGYNSKKTPQEVFYKMAKGDTAQLGLHPDATYQDFEDFLIELFGCVPDTLSIVQFDVLSGSLNDLELPYAGGKPSMQGATLGRKVQLIN